MEQLSILKVLKPQGLKGELKCLPLDNNPQVFSNLTEVFCDGKTYNVISSVFRLGFVYIMLENVNSIEEAEKFRNKEFFISRQQFGDLGDSTYFIEDLVGLTVYGEDGTEIGEVLSVENYGATDLLEIKDEWRTYLVPFIKKVFVNINIAEKKIIVNYSEYLEHRA